MEGSGPPPLQRAVLSLSVASSTDAEALQRPAAVAAMVQALHLVVLGVSPDGAVSIEGIAARTNHSRRLEDDVAALWVVEVRFAVRTVGRAEASSVAEALHGLSRGEARPLELLSEALRRELAARGVPVQVTVVGVELPADAAEESLDGGDPATGATRDAGLAGAMRPTAATRAPQTTKGGTGLRPVLLAVLLAVAAAAALLAATGVKVLVRRRRRRRKAAPATKVPPLREAWVSVGGGGGGGTATPTQHPTASRAWEDVVEKRSPQHSPVPSTRTSTPIGLKEVATFEEPGPPTALLSAARASAWESSSLYLDEVLSDAGISPAGPCSPGSEARAVEEGLDPGAAAPGGPLSPALPPVLPPAPQ